MHDFVIITINGNDYYVPANMVEYITSNGVSTYSSNFYGYQNIDNSTTGTNYPRIQFRSNGYPIYQNGTNNYQVLTNATVTFSTNAQLYRFRSMADLYSPFLLLIIAFFVMFRRFSR